MVTEIEFALLGKRNVPFELVEEVLQLSIVVVTGPKSHFDLVVPVGDFESIDHVVEALLVFEASQELQHSVLPNDVRFVREIQVHEDPPAVHVLLVLPRGLDIFLKNEHLAPRLQLRG